MQEFRVCKYDPQYRVDGVYKRNEWTSFSDVGRSFDGTVLMEDEYLQVEQNHIEFLCRLADREGDLPLTITTLEIYDASCTWQDGQQLTQAEMPQLIRSILREQCWCRLQSDHFFIHFGRDYYIYVGCSFTQEAISQLAGEYSLFAEPMRSPYHPESDDDTASPDLRPMTAIYLTRGEQILLLYRIGSRVVGNSYTGTAGGHMEADEYNSARTCVLRELREETGLSMSDIEGLAMRYVTMRLKGGEIRQNYYFFATLREGAEPHDSNEGRLEWFKLNALPDLPMPHTAKQVLLHYVREGRHSDLLYGVVSRQDDAVFTPLTEF